jgi:outer membrane autotransporter protein
MNADLTLALTGTLTPAALAANYLVVNNGNNLTQSVHINTDTALPTGVNISIPMILLADNGATGDTDFTLANPGGKIDLHGLTALELLPGDNSIHTPNPNIWYLTDRAYSHTADAILNIASTMPLDWAYSLDSLHLRMGEIRTENVARADVARASSPWSSSSTGFQPVNPSAQTAQSNPSASSSPNGNLWVRTRAYRLNATNPVTRMSYRTFAYGVTAGLDKLFHTENSVTLLGAFIDAGRITRDFDITGSGGNGQSNTIGLGAYLTLLNNQGWFADLVARADRYSNSFDARAYNGAITQGNYSVAAAGLSLELGKRFTRQNGWWVEPTLQAAILWMNTAAFETRATATHPPMHVNIASAQSAQYRAQVRFGKQIQDSRWTPYGKLAAVAVDAQSAPITAHNKTVNASNSGKRAEFGLGTAYRIDLKSQFYLDYQYDKSPQYERPWSFNFGYRRVW